jgi:nucleotide-binding universal stress UspA family protein
MASDPDSQVPGTRRSAPAAAAMKALDPKTIAVFLDASPSGQRRAEHAAALAIRWDADVVGVQVIANPELPGYMHNARGRGVVQVIHYERRLEAEAKVAALLEGERFQALCARMQAHCEFRMIGPGEANQEAILNAFQSDVVVVGHPEPHGLPPHMAPERMLLESGVPLLIIPNAWQGETIGERIVIGWNATRAARHAVADAMAFLVAARAVTVLLIDPQEHWGHGRAPGADVAKYLTRHGAPVTVQRVTTHGSSIADALLSYVEQQAADLLVLGAYSHARLRELLLGGVTRTLLSRMPVPVLISR